jgi:AAA15 family ATPase/GTPase
MIRDVKVENFGPLSNIDWSGLGAINLIIGPNASGKTAILKAIYSAIACMESVGKGNDKRSLKEVLSEKLRWTFEVDSLSDLVLKGKQELKFSLQHKRQLKESRSLSYSISAMKKTSPIISTDSKGDRLEEVPVFFPAKEILSVFEYVIELHDKEKSFGFDETYVDLARAISYAKTKGKNFENFTKARKILKDNIVKGTVSYSKDLEFWQYTQKANNNTFHIRNVAEGVKKISILDTLLGNRHIKPGATLFFDEPEAGLHPSAIYHFMEIVEELSGLNRKTNELPDSLGLQFFFATHSYFVIKCMAFLAKKHRVSIPLLAFESDGTHSKHDLKDGMPKNSIIEESIRLYHLEVEELMK